MNPPIFEKAITDFFSSYVEVDPRGFNPDGTLKRTMIQTIAVYLIEQLVFITVKDMKTAALKDYSIILPEWVFAYVKKDLGGKNNNEN